MFKSITIVLDINDVSHFRMEKLKFKSNLNHQNNDRLHIKIHVIHFNFYKITQPHVLFVSKQLKKRHRC